MWVQEQMRPAVRVRVGVRVFFGLCRLKVVVGFCLSAPFTSPVTKPAELWRLVVNYTLTPHSAMLTQPCVFILRSKILCVHLTLK